MLDTVGVEADSLANRAESAGGARLSDGAGLFRCWSGRRRELRQGVLGD